jgi:carbon monoxide dehydrogenase subunit G
MAMRIEERFTVKAPAPAVWAYLVDPRRVVTCLPGAELTAVVDERTFHGQVKVKVGAMTVAYKGLVRIAELDEQGLRVRMTGEGRESGGAGSAKMTMESRLAALPDGGTEVVVQADVDVVGRLVQLGRGMIEQVSHQLFGQFATCVRATLEAEAGARAIADPTAPSPRPSPPLRGGEGGEEGTPTASSTLHPRSAAPVRLIPLLAKALWAWITSLFRRRAGPGAAPGR